jgi:hypothetical protein
MRRALDRLVSWIGLAITAVLLVAGALLTWGSTFVAGQVHDQLSMQGITMPSGAALDALPAADKAAMQPFAGQPMNTGPQAEAYANHFILVHMNEGTDTLFKTLQGLGIDTKQWAGLAPLTYASAGGVASDLANATKTPGLTDDQRTQGAAAVTAFRTSTLFTGNTLRGLLLYGYAFATIGAIAGFAAIGAFVGAGVMLILSILGFWHAARQSRIAAGAGVPPGVPAAA